MLANHWLIQMVAPGMIERRDGSIVIVSSIGGLKGSPTLGAYDISKAADMQLARNLAVEWGRGALQGRLHRAGTDPHRLRPRAVGEPRHAAGGRGGDAA